MRKRLTKEIVDEAYKPLYDLLKEKYCLDLSFQQMEEIVDTADTVNHNMAELVREKCDAVGCEEDSSNGGCAWRETGYWNFCNKHFSDSIAGLPQPEIKPEAIEREKSRGPDGMLPDQPWYPFK